MALPCKCDKPKIKEIEFPECDTYGIKSGFIPMCENCGRVVPENKHLPS